MLSALEQQVPTYSDDVVDQYEPEVSTGAVPRTMHPRLRTRHQPLVGSSAAPRDSEYVCRGQVLGCALWSVRLEAGCATSIACLYQMGPGFENAQGTTPTACFGCGPQWGSPTTLTDVTVWDGCRILCCLCSTARSCRSSVHSLFGRLPSPTRSHDGIRQGTLDPGIQSHGWVAQMFIGTPAPLPCHRRPCVD